MMTLFILASLMFSDQTQIKAKDLAPEISGLAQADSLYH